jgi:hypothetical protein
MGAVSVPFVLLLLFISAVVFQIRRQFTERRALAIAVGRLAADPELDVERELERFDSSKEPLTVAQTSLVLAESANRAGDFARALAQSERGLHPLQGVLMRAVASDMLIPALVTERAIANAALGKIDDAIADVEAIPEDVPFRARSVFSVKLIAFARSDLDKAARIALGKSSEMTLAPRIDALADLMIATQTLEGLGLAERARLRDDLRRDATLHPWLRAIAPDALADFERLDNGADEAPSGVRVQLHGRTTRSDALLEEELGALHEAEVELLGRYAAQRRRRTG